MPLTTPLTPGPPPVDRWAGSATDSVPSSWRPGCRHWPSLSVRVSSSPTPSSTSSSTPPASSTGSRISGTRRPASARSPTRPSATGSRWAPSSGWATASGLAPWVIQRLWIAALLVVAFWGMLRVLEALGVGRPGGPHRRSARPTRSARSCSPRSPTDPAASCPRCFVPLALAPLITGAREGSPRRAAARSAVAVAFMGGVNGAATLLVLAVPVLYLLTREPGRPSPPADPVVGRPGRRRHALVDRAPAAPAALRPRLPLGDRAGRGHHPGQLPRSDPPRHGLLGTGPPGRRTALASGRGPLRVPGRDRPGDGGDRRLRCGRPRSHGAAGASLPGPVAGGGGRRDGRRLRRTRRWAAVRPGPGPARRTPGAGPQPAQDGSARRLAPGRRGRPRARPVGDPSRGQDRDARPGRGRAAPRRRVRGVGGHPGRSLGTAGPRRAGSIGRFRGGTGLLAGRDRLHQRGGPRADPVAACRPPWAEYEWGRPLDEPLQAAERRRLGRAQHRAARRPARRPASWTGSRRSWTTGRGSPGLGGRAPALGHRVGPGPQRPRPANGRRRPAPPRSAGSSSSPRASPGWRRGAHRSSIPSTDGDWARNWSRPQSSVRSSSTAWTARSTRYDSIRPTTSSWPPARQSPPSP